MAGGIKGGDAFRAQLQGLEKKMSKPGYLAVGFLENARYPNGVSVAMIAAVQNFGSPAKGIPPRPFFTHFVEQNEASWPRRFGNVLKAADYDLPLALARMGEGMTGQLRKSIVETNAPPLSPVTLLLRKWFPTNPWDVTFADVQRARAEVGAFSKPLPSSKDPALAAAMRRGGASRYGHAGEYDDLHGRTSTGAKPLVWSGTLFQSVDNEVVA